MVAWDQMPPTRRWVEDRQWRRLCRRGRIGDGRLENLRRSQALLARLVIQDQLTNVLNARAFAERLTRS